MTKVGATLAYLRKCQTARDAGLAVSYTTDPAWLVQIAINRRAGWPDDPSHVRGSARPVCGRHNGRLSLKKSMGYPLKASGDTWCHLRLIAREINTPRLVVRLQRLGEWRKLLLSRVPHRITVTDDF